MKVTQSDHKIIDKLVTCSWSNLQRPTQKIIRVGHFGDESLTSNHLQVADISQKANEYNMHLDRQNIAVYPRKLMRKTV